MAIVPTDVIHPGGLILKSWFPSDDEATNDVLSWINQGYILYPADDEAVTAYAYVRAFQYISNKRKTSPMVTQYTDHREEYDRYQLAALEAGALEAQKVLDKVTQGVSEPDHPNVAARVTPNFPIW